MEAKTLQIITNELYKYGKLIKEEEIKEVVDLCQKAGRRSSDRRIRIRKNSKSCL